MKKNWFLKKIKVLNLYIANDIFVFEKIINWENDYQKCHIITLSSTLEEIMVLKQQFDFIFITHVYRERNFMDDKLSKEGT